MTRWASRAWKRNVIRPSGCVQHARAALDRPVTGERPLVEHQHVRCLVGAGPADLGAAP